MRREGGLTLLELLVAMALFGALAAAGAAVLGSAVRLASAAARWAEAEHHARTVLERMSLRLRAAGYASGVRFTVADRSRVEFLADFDPGVPGPEPHGFYLGDDGVLRERSGEGRFALTTGQDGLRVVSFQLAYFDGAGRELGPLPLGSSEREEVARVRVRVVYSVLEGASRGPRRLEAEGHVAVRGALE